MTKMQPFKTFSKTSPTTIRALNTCLRRGLALTLHVIGAERLVSFAA